MYGEKELTKETLESFLKILNPICPHITEELWTRLGNKDFISVSSWPKAKEVKAVKKEIDLNFKVVELVKDLIKDKDVSKVYLYAVPFEVDKLDSKKLEKELGKEVAVYSVRDSGKYDPQNKSRKARPGLPGIWLE